MRTRLCLYVMICVFLLSGCDFPRENTPSFNDVVSFAKENREDFIDCSHFLLKNFATEDDAINITMNENGTMRLYSYHLESAKEERIPEVEPLLAGSILWQQPYGPKALLSSFRACIVYDANAAFYNAETRDACDSRHARLHYERHYPGITDVRQLEENWFAVTSQ